LTWLWLSLAVLGVGGLGALAAGRHERMASMLGAGGAVVGSTLGLVPALRVLAGAELAAVDLAWSVPGGRFALAIDPLSAFFLVPLFVVSAVTAIHGYTYLRHEAHGRSLSAAWLWFDLLVAAMVLVLTARNALLFLFAWEAMALASYFLIVLRHERDDVQHAGWIYLVATHLGTACLLAFFGGLARASGSLDFADFAGAGNGWLFALALAGFGAKAGLFPFHVWLPEAHPAAPSPVSALLSGVMIKTGIYGLVRTLLWLGPPPPSVGLALLAIGVASAVVGVLLALAQRDLKRLLAFSSVENVGIVALGLGVGALGASVGAPAVAAFAFSGALLQIWSHALAKTLLFLGSGNVAQAVGTLDLERLGGLLRRLPRTGAAFVAGAATICALPPLAGFPGELSIGLAALRGIAAGPAPTAWLVALAALGFVAGLAVACFAKAVGVAFLGQPRSAGAATAREVGRAMTGTCAILAIGCAGLGLASPLVLVAAGPVVAELSGGSPALAAPLSELREVLARVSLSGAVLLLAVAAIALSRRALLRGREVGAGPTWDCGFAAPTPRMQYTGASFVQPVTEFFAAAFGASRSGTEPVGLFPAPSRLETRAPDPVRERLFDPLFTTVERLARQLRALEGGSVHRCVLYLVLATVALFAWKLG
jgi:formate hydrogenlyase subunit 3/multisubunit Na+/H+ antiporter MnhD subunit